MTEQEWLVCTDPQIMLEFLRDKVSDRKLRLFACAFSPDERGPAAPSAYDGAWDAVDWLTILERWWRDDPDSYFPIPADAVLKRSAVLLRDICGNLFRPLPPLPPAVLAWHDGAIRKMAQTIYDERAFDRLPVLADALEDAGCQQADILAHCRAAGRFPSVLLMAFKRFLSRKRDRERTKRRGGVIKLMPLDFEVGEGR
jgi:hypothetical protein